MRRYVRRLGHRRMTSWTLGRPGNGPKRRNSILKVSDLAVRIGKPPWLFPNNSSARYQDWQVVGSVSEGTVLDHTEKGYLRLYRGDNWVSISIVAQCLHPVSLVD